MITMEPQKNYPAFMKPIFGDCLYRLQIHPAFTSFMKSVMPEKAFLRNFDGKFWTVGVTKIGDNFYFQQGWRNFMEENHVKFGDFLVFQYNGESVFAFKILGKMASEKEILKAFEFEFDGQDEQEEADEMLNRTTPERKVEASGEGSSALKKNMDVDVKAGEDGDEDGPAKTGYINGNPFFVTKITGNKKGGLFVPSEIMNENEVKLEGVVTLKDTGGRLWRLKASRQKDGSVRLQGWNRFCKHKSLRFGDECVCEIVSGEDGKCSYIQVY